MDAMTIGQVVDYIITWNSIMQEDEEDEEESAQGATQAQWDHF